MIARCWYKICLVERFIMVLQKQMLIRKVSSISFTVEFRRETILARSWKIWREHILKRLLDKMAQSMQPYSKTRVSFKAFIVELADSEQIRSKIYFNMQRAAEYKQNLWQSLNQSLERMVQTTKFQKWLFLLRIILAQPKNCCAIAKLFPSDANRKSNSLWKTCRNILQ